MKKAFVDAKGALLIMKITNRRSTCVCLCVFFPSIIVFTGFPSSLSPPTFPPSHGVMDKVCLHFHFLIKTLLSQREFAIDKRSDISRII